MLAGQRTSPRDLPKHQKRPLIKAIISHHFGIRSMGHRVYAPTNAKPSQTLRHHLPKAAPILSGEYETYFILILTRTSRSFSAVRMRRAAISDGK
jgi:hypothetical protein